MALVVLPIQPNSGVLVLPTGIHPAARSLATKGLSVVAGGIVLVEGGSEGGGVAGEILEVLDGEGDAGEWPGVGAGGDAVVEGFGVG